MELEFYRIYGIMDERNVEGKVTLLEIQRIFRAINVPEYYPLFEELILNTKSLNAKGKVPIKTVLKMLDCQDFVLSLPLRCNNHPSFSNVMLLKAAFIIFLKHLLSYFDRENTIIGFQK